MAAKTISTSSFDWKHAVFLSFRGEDTSNNFTGHLYKALDQKGIDTLSMIRILEKVKRDISNAYNSDPKIKVLYHCSVRKLWILQVVFRGTCGDTSVQLNQKQEGRAYFL